MKLHKISALWLVLTVGLPIVAGRTAAISADATASSSSGKDSSSAAGDLPDLTSMATELNNRSTVLEKEIIELCDLPAIQERLAQKAKETKNLSRELKLFKHASQYGYDALFDIKAGIGQQAGDLKEIFRTTSEAVNQATRLQKEWSKERLRWEQLKWALLKQAPSHVLEPTFANVRRIIAGSQERIGQAIESLTAQRQVAEVIRASQSSLDIELDALVSALHDNLMQKTARSMFSSIQVKADHIVNRSALLTGTFILVAWRIYSNPVEAIQAAWSFGTVLGSRRITVGLVLPYCAFFISWSVQAILMDGLFTRRQLQVGVRISMARLVHYGFVCLGFFLALLTLGVQLRDLTIVAGALGVGIGFGLQNIINNFVSGLILLFERPIKVGDYIELGAQRVEIKKIGLRSTVVRAFDRSEIVVPNNDLITSQVTNWTLSDPFAGIRIPVRVACDSDVPEVMAVLLSCAREHRQVVAHPSAKVFFMGFGESALEFELQGWIGDVDSMIQKKSELYEAIERKFRSKGIRVPYPQQDLNVNVVAKPAPAVSDRSQARHFDLYARRATCS